MIVSANAVVNRRKSLIAASTPRSLSSDNINDIEKTGLNHSGRLSLNAINITFDDDNKSSNSSMMSSSNSLYIHNGSPHATLTVSPNSKIAEFLEQRRPRRVSVATAVAKSKNTSISSPSTPTNNQNNHETTGKSSSPLMNDIVNHEQQPLPPSNISFAVSRLESIVENPLCLARLKESLIYNGSDAFHHFCSLITRGKESSSPSRKRRKEAYLEIFAGLVGLTSSKIYEEKISLDSIKASYYDVVIGLQSLSDRWLAYPTDELYSLVFLFDTNERGYIIWADFFEFLVGVHEAVNSDHTVNPTDAIESLYDDLRQLSVQSSLGINPFSQTLGAGSQYQSALDDATYAVIQSLAVYARTVLHLQPLSIFLVYLQQHCNFELSSNAIAHILGMIGATIVNDVSNNGGSCNSSPATGTANRCINDTGNTITNQSKVFSHSISNKSVDDAASLDECIERLRENALAISAKLSSQESSLEATIGLFEAIKTIEQNIDKQAPASSCLSTVPSSPSSMHNPSTTSVTSRLFGMQAVAEVEQGTDPVGNQHPFDNNCNALSPIPHQQYLQQHHISTPSPSSAPMLSTANQSMNSSSNNMSCTKAGTITNRRKSLVSSTMSSPAAPLSKHTSNISSISNSSNRGIHTPKSKDISRNIHRRNTTKPVDLSIFRSPQSRQSHHTERNTYDEDAYAWKSSIHITKKYTERFQTTNDIIDAKKINSIFRC